MSAPLSTDLDDPESYPYFLWDDPMSVRDLRLRLASASEPERVRLLSTILREARATEVWKFTTLDEVLALWPAIRLQLGRRRDFWEWLFAEWRREGLLGR